MKKTVILALAMTARMAPAMAEPHCWFLSYAYNAPPNPGGVNQSQPTSPPSGLASFEISSKASEHPPTWEQLVLLARSNALRSQLIDQTGVITPISLSTIGCSVSDHS